MEGREGLGIVWTAFKNRQGGNRHRHSQSRARCLSRRSREADKEERLEPSQSKTTRRHWLEKLSVEKEEALMTKRAPIGIDNRVQTGAFLPQGGNITRRVAVSQSDRAGAFCKAGSHRVEPTELAGPPDAPTCSRLQQASDSIT